MLGELGRAARPGRPRLDQVLKPLSFSQAAAIWSGSSLSTSAFLFIWMRASVVSLAETLFRIAAASADSTWVRPTGTTLSAFWRCLSSCSCTYLPVEYALSLEKISPTSMSPLSRAALVSGPPESRGLNDLKRRPYVFSRPIWQKGRVGHSGGPPRVIWAAVAARSDSFVTLPYLPLFSTAN